MAKTKRAASRPRLDDAARRDRILGAAFSVLMARGYAGTSTLEIATRARMSKRELYAHFRSKEGILAALVDDRSARMRAPLALPAVSDRRGLAATLARFGAAVLREASQPAVTALFRLAVAESERAPEVARTLDAAGRQANRAALAAFLADAQARGLLGRGDPAAMASRFLSLLWDDLLVRLLLRVAAPPARAEIERRARDAVAAFLALNGAPAARGAR
jgi:AcrR family transcriptional regulator